MNFSLLAGFALALYVAGSICYVSRFRGKARYETFTQYMRKSWPVFAPMNCVLYMATKRHARLPVINASFLDDIAVLRTQWHVIRAEAVALHEGGDLSATSRPGSAGFHDLGFRTFYKRGWMKFYLKWYGPPHQSARRLCPETIRIVEQLPWIRGAMFSVLPAGSELSIHSDPLACSLRYHLGLNTPNSDACQLIVDGSALTWRDGQDFVFDETYPHSAINASDRDRIILMCDVERPMHAAGRFVNRIYSLIARGMRVPNTAEDSKGLISQLFALVEPLRAAGQDLKKRKRPLYKALKHTINAGLVTAALCAAYLCLRFFEVAALEAWS